MTEKVNMGSGLARLLLREKQPPGNDLWSVKAPFTLFCSQYSVFEELVSGNAHPHGACGFDAMAHNYWENKLHGCTCVCVNHKDSFYSYAEWVTFS
jgi:hypothetical protein